MRGIKTDQLLTLPLMLNVSRLIRQIEPAIRTARGDGDPSILLEDVFDVEDIMSCYGILICGHACMS